MAFRCDIHKFETENIEAWQVHIAEEEHEHTGHTPCKDCGKPNTEISHKGKLHKGHLPPAYCSECLGKLKVRFS